MKWSFFKYEMAYLNFINLDYRGSKLEKAIVFSNLGDSYSPDKKVEVNASIIMSTA